MSEGDPTKLKLITSMKESLIMNPTAVVGPSYHAMNKILANLYFGVNQELKGIYHLTEAHTATLRQQTAIKFDYKEDLIKNPSKSSNSTRLPVSQGIQKTVIDFDNEITLQEEVGLLSRLREMPKEWTVVQLTRQIEPQARFTVRPKDFVTQPTSLYIVRLPCGAMLEDSSPVSVMVPPPQGNEGMPTLFDLIHKAKELLRTKHARARDIRKARETASQLIKDVVVELSSRFLREWRCLLLGSLCSSHYSEKVKDCIDKVTNNSRHNSYSLDSRSRQLLYSVADGAVHLTLQEIQSAVACLVQSKDLAADLITAIEIFKEDMSKMIVARRHPVILILDEELDFLPWEMIPTLKRHPVSRVPSIHFLHALYHEHKDHIVDGCRLVNRLDIGYYIINPDGDLRLMENQLVKFLEKRIPEWKGIKGTNPTQDEFCSALVENNIFLYCGHFNGTHFLRPEEISSLRVVALPLLFGCSSVALQALGGRAQPSGVSDKYMMSGSACVLGMLWTVTSDDTDCMTVTLLNSWLPGKPIDLRLFRSDIDLPHTQQEQELLRILRHARDVAQLFSNSAALIARGIPVKMSDD